MIYVRCIVIQVSLVRVQNWPEISTLHIAYEMSQSKYCRMIWVTRVKEVMFIRMSLIAPEIWKIQKIKTLNFTHNEQISNADLSEFIKAKK